MDTFYGFKIGQGQDYDESGKRVPVTQIRVNPGVVVGVKTTEKDGYNALRIALGFKKHLNKPLLGLLKKLSVFANASTGKAEKISPQFIKEIKLDESDKLDQLDKLDKININDVFTVGDKVKVSGISKGKGFAGVVKRHGFHGGPKTHGQSDRQRHPGSIGSTTTPGRVLKGKRMGGHMGHVQSTVKNLSVFSVSPEENLLVIRGLIPGPKGTLVKVSK